MTGFHTGFAGPGPCYCARCLTGGLKGSIRGTDPTLLLKQLLLITAALFCFYKSSVEAFTV